MAEQERPTPLAPHLIRIALLCASYPLFFCQLRHPVIRLESRGLNSLAGLFWGLGTPWAVLACIFWIRRRWSTVIGLLALFPLQLYSQLFALAFMFLDGMDSVKRFGEISWKHSSVGLYTTDGGALGDRGVLIRHEKTLLPGVLLVREVDYISSCRTVESSATSRGIIIRIHPSECQALGEQTREYQLHRFIYF